MKLLIVSHTEHYCVNGGVAGWGATVREIDHLAKLFDEVAHVAPVHETKEIPKNSKRYEARNVRVIPVRPAGGRSIKAKLGILLCLPSYAVTILRELQNSDVVHVRCPANIAMIAILVLALVRSPTLRWVKYAGNWSPTDRESWSYSFQRWWLRKGFVRSVVTVNGEWPAQPSHVHSFVNPCLTDLEIEDGKARSQKKKFSEPYRLIYVGRVETPKGADRAIRAMTLLRERNIKATLEIVGDGPECVTFKTLTNELGLSDCVRFHGWLARDMINEIYATSHFILLPAYSSEGWPKVLSEAMAYGVIPIAGNVSSMPQYLETFQCGRVVSPKDLHAIGDAIMDYIKSPQTWKLEAEYAVTASKRFTYESYLESVRDLLGLEKLAVEELVDA